MPKTSQLSFDALLRDVISQALRDELGDLRREMTVLRADLARRSAAGSVKGSVAVAAGRKSSSGRAMDRQRGGQRPPGTMTASQVKAIRTRLGVSQKRFAELTGVTPVAVYFWESGRTTPSIDREKALLKLGQSAPAGKSSKASAKKKAGKRPGKKSGKRARK